MEKITKYKLQIGYTPAKRESFTDFPKAGSPASIFFGKDENIVWENVVLTDNTVRLYGIWGILEYIRGQINAVKLLFRNKASKQQTLVLTLLYSVLSYGLLNLNRFFAHGWSLEIIKRIGEGNNILSPKVKNLQDIGGYIKQGIKLMTARTFYELPRVIFLALFGAKIIQFVFEFGKWMTKYIGTRGDIGGFWIYLTTKNEGSAYLGTSVLDDIGIGIALELVLLALYGLIVTPAFKIMTFRYAFGEITWKELFSIKKIREAFAIYKKYPRSTLAAYLWSLMVGMVSSFVNLVMIMVLPVLGLFIIPGYNLSFKYWPKAYGYGKLARKLIVNGDIVPPITVP
ncbi:MAG: hypothetical protein R3D00_11000 [Bacteroidia bacterium]